MLSVSFIKHGPYSSILPELGRWFDIYMSHAKISISVYVNYYRANEMIIFFYQFLPGHKREEENVLNAIVIIIGNRIDGLSSNPGWRLFLKVEFGQIANKKSDFQEWLPSNKNFSFCFCYFSFDS